MKCEEKQGKTMTSGKHVLFGGGVESGNKADEDNAGFKVEKVFVEMFRVLLGSSNAW